MDMQSLSDGELIPKILEDTQNFACLVERYQTRLMRYVQMISHASDEEAEEILQEVFIKVYRHLNEFQPALKFSSWIYRMAHNEAISFYRHHKSEYQKRQLIYECDTHFMDEFLSDVDMQASLEKSDIQDIVLQTIQDLPTPYRDVAILRFLEDKNYDEISDILRKPIGTISTTVGRTRKKIQDQLRQKVESKII